MSDMPVCDVAVRSAFGEGLALGVLAVVVLLVLAWSAMDDGGKTQGGGGE